MSPLPVPLELPGRAVQVGRSVVTVFNTIRERQPVTSTDIQAITGIPQRTVYAALRTLRGHKLLKERPVIRDMRRINVWLADHLQPPKMCLDCPFQTNGKAVKILPPERHDRLAMLAASGVPVQCHSATDLDLVRHAEAEGGDWRLDHLVTRPCAGIPKVV